MNVSPEEEQVIENGNVVVYTVDMMDKSGNPTTESKASVTCKVQFYSYWVPYVINFCHLFYLFLIHYPVPFPGNWYPVFALITDETDTDIFLNDNE